MIQDHRPRITGNPEYSNVEIFKPGGNDTHYVRRLPAGQPEAHAQDQSNNTTGSALPFAVRAYAETYYGFADDRLLLETENRHLWSATIKIMIFR
jgi:hypothetical protein